jgi:hypothetical protein
MRALALAIVGAVLVADASGSGAARTRRGVGATYEDCSGVRRSGASWFYDWTADPAVCDDVESVPMVWCTGATGWEIGGNSEWVLGWNEPDVYSQCNLTPEEGVDHWVAMESSYPDRLLVSPAVLNLQWLIDWRAAFEASEGRAPRVDAVGVHCYWWGVEPELSAAFCQDQVDKAADLAANWGARGVWLTEFAHLCDPEEMDDYLDVMLPWLEEHPGVLRYAWFQLSYEGTEGWAFGPGCNTSLIDWETGDLTPAGRRYRVWNARYPAPKRKVWLPAVWR